jgi:hypothetical protein
MAELDVEGGFSGADTIFSLSIGQSSCVALQLIYQDYDLRPDLAGYGRCFAAAVFKVVSATEITGTVPTGATTGTVNVKTPRGTLISNVNFLVTP